MKEAMSIPAAVGAFVSDVRRERGLTLDQIAHAGRSHGASWSASSVSNIERGQASLTLPSLVLLALALGDLLGHPLALSSLLGDVEIVELAPGAKDPVKRSWIDSVLAGAPVNLGPEQSLDDGTDWVIDEELEDRVSSRMREMRGREMTDAEKDGQFAQLLDESQAPRAPRGSTQRKDRAGTLAEERAATKLGISLARLQQTAQRIWGRPLEAESSRRAGIESTPQARGRITRVLVEEIRESMKDGR